MTTRVLQPTELEIEKIRLAIWAALNYNKSLPQYGDKADVFKGKYKDFLRNTLGDNSGMVCNIATKRAVFINHFIPIEYKLNEQGTAFVLNRDKLDLYIQALPFQEGIPEVWEFTDKSESEHTEVIKHTFDIQPDGSVKTVEAISFIKLSDTMHEATRKQIDSCSALNRDLKAKSHEITDRGKFVFHGSLSEYGNYGSVQWLDGRVYKFTSSFGETFEFDADGNILAVDDIGSRPPKIQESEPLSIPKK